MSNSKKTSSKQAATAASKTLTDGRTSDDSKTASGSALSQAAKTPRKSTDHKAASSASDVLQSDDTGAKSKTAAASALAQTTTKIPANRWPCLIGFDNTPTGNGFLLSSLRLPWEELASRAPRLLWERRHRRLLGEPVHESVPMSLLSRLTCRTNWSTAPQTAALATL